MIPIRDGLVTRGAQLAVRWLDYVIASPRAHFTYFPHLDAAWFQLD